MTVPERRHASSRRLFVAAVIAAAASASVVASPREVGAQQSTGESTGEVIALEQTWVTSIQLPEAGDPLAYSTLGPGDLPVGLFGAEETKRSYLLLEIPPEATAATIALERSDSLGTNFGVAGTVLACLVTEPFAVETGASIDTAPAIDCDDEVVGQPAQLDGVIDETDDTVGDPEGVFEFVLDPLVERWAGGEPNHGIALAADTRLPGTYQVTFRADYFAPIGTYRIAAGSSGEAEEGFNPPPLGSGSMDVPPSSSDFGQPAPFTAPFTVTTPTTPEPPSAVVADSGDDMAIAAPTTELASRPPLEPFPMNPLWWLLLPLGVTALWASGRGLAAAGEATSALDRVLDRAHG